MAMIAPCKGCPDRTTCERFAEFKASCAAVNKARYEYQQGISATFAGFRRLQENPPTGGNKRPWHR